MTRSTSKAAYQELPQIKINRQERDILKYVLKRIKPVSRRQIAKALKMETSTISARCNNMIKWGVLLEDEKMKCPISGKTVGALSA